jgi:hypothetical protein
MQRFIKGTLNLRAKLTVVHEKIHVGIFTDYKKNTLNGHGTFGCYCSSVLYIPHYPHLIYLALYIEKYPAAGTAGKYD